jgi:hypothetical protein
VNLRLILDEKNCIHDVIGKKRRIRERARAHARIGEVATTGR